MLASVVVLAIGAPQGELVIVTADTKQYHRPGCDLIRDGKKEVLAMTRAQADSRGFTSHDGCDPARAKSEGGGPEKAAPVVYVFIDDGGKQYHKEGCRRIGKNPRKVKLDDAGRKHWPCTVCKPPIRPRPKK